MQPLLDRIVDLPDDAPPHLPAVQTANLLLRWCVSSKCVHLLRLLPPRLTESFAADIDERVRAAFCKINNIGGNLEVTSHLLYATSMSYGGLGMRPLREHRAAAFVGCWLQVMAHVRTHHSYAIAEFDCGWQGAPVHPFHRDFSEASDELDHQLGERGAALGLLQLSVADMLARERPKLQKELSRAVAAKRFSEWKEGMDPKCRAAGILAAASAEGRRPLASEWLVTTPCTKTQEVPDENYRLLIKLRLGLPVTLHGEPCRVQTQSQCRHQLTSYADHAFACAKAARQATHDSVADLNAAFHREAGHRAWREAAVPEARSRIKNKPIRADVLTRRGPTDPAECTDVKLRHTWTTQGELQITRADDWDNYIAAEEDRIQRKYNPVRVRPWVFSTLGRPGEQFCSDLRRLTRERLGRCDARRAVSSASLRQTLLRRWRAQLSCTLAIGISNTLLDSLEGTAACGEMAAPRPTQFYDLQSYRFTGY